MIKNLIITKRRRRRIKEENNMAINLENNVSETFEIFVRCVKLLDNLENGEPKRSIIQGRVLQGLKLLQGTRYYQMAIDQYRTILERHGLYPT